MKLIPDWSRPGLTTTAVSAVDLHGMNGLLLVKEEEEEGVSVDRD